MGHPAKLAHVVLYTGQVSVMRDWYKKVLGAKVVHENAAVAFLTYDEEHHRIAFADRDAVSKMSEALDSLTGGNAAQAAENLLPPNKGLAHIAFTFASLPELFAHYEELKGESIAPVFTINHGPTTSLYYADPDGNQIELQIDNFETIAQGMDYMQSEAFERNPVGVPIDVDQMIAQLRAGEKPADIVRPNW